MKEVDESDLWKIHDVLLAAVEHHTHRDVSNGYLHLAKETRLSPLTSELSAALDRVKVILKQISRVRADDQIAVSTQRIGP